GTHRSGGLRGVTMYAPVFRHVLFPLYESVLRRRPTLRHLARLERQQWWGRDRLLRLQREKLAALLRHAYEQVPYYRRRWDAIGAHPAGIRTPQDFARLPVLTKADIRAHRANLEAANY